MDPRTRLLILFLGGVLASSGCNRESSSLPQAVAAAAEPALTVVEQHGADLYGRICSVCHGADGAGYKADRAPALNRADFLGGVSDEFLRRAIADGRQGSTMSAWANNNGGPFSRSDIDAVVAFIRTWHRQPPTLFDEQPLHGDIAHGVAIYRSECVTCHGAGGRGGDYVQIGNPQLLEGVSNGFLRAAIRDGRPGTQMPSFATKLDAQGIEDVVAHLRNLQKTALPAMPSPRATAPPLPLGPVPLNPKGPDALGFKIYPETTPVEVVHQQLVRQARIAILDARAPSDYMNEHIAGAVSVPFYDPSPYYDALPKDAWLVCYCSCPSAESGELAKKLQEHGFKNVTVLAEGFGLWRTKQYGTHTGDKP